MHKKGIYGTIGVLVRFLSGQANLRDFFVQLPNIAIFRKILDRLAGLDYFATFSCTLVADGVYILL